MERRGRRRDTAGEGRGGKKLSRPGILELLGEAMGCMGISYDDFCRLTFAEFGAVHRAFHEMRAADMRGGWEMTRTHAAITIAPHLDKRHKMTPQKLLPLPWDNEKKGGADAPRLTPAEQRARAKALIEEREKRLNRKRDGI